MATGDGWLSQFADGLAQYMDDHSVGVYRSDGSAYEADEIAICDTDIPPEPDQVITITAYLVSGTPGMQDVTIGVQFRIRGTSDPRSCRDIYSVIFEQFDSCGHIVLGDIAIVDATWRSHVALGQDTNQRRETSTNFYFQAMWPTASRTQ